MTEIRPIQKFYEGTAIKITAILSVNTADTAKIKIVDPSNIAKVTAGNMTKETDKVYTYIYQSTDGDNTGDYIITITATYAGYTTVFQDKFTLIDQQPV